jgi:hypothetical protein
MSVKDTRGEMQDVRETREKTGHANIIRRDLNVIQLPKST